MELAVSLDTKICKALNQRKKENVKYLYILQKDHEEPIVSPSHLTLKMSRLHIGIRRRSGVQLCTGFSGCPACPAPTWPNLGPLPFAFALPTSTPCPEFLQWQAHLFMALPLAFASEFVRVEELKAQDGSVHEVLLENNLKPVLRLSWENVGHGGGSEDWEQVYAILHRWDNLGAETCVTLKKVQWRRHMAEGRT